MPDDVVAAIARYYATVVQGLSVQARDGATREELEAIITCAMAAWDGLRVRTNDRPLHALTRPSSTGG